MSTNHTPGPWYPIYYPGYWCLQANQTNDWSSSEELLDAEVCDQAEANATLAAAAPDLLEACVEMLTIMNGFIQLGDWFTKEEKSLQEGERKGIMKIRKIVAQSEAAIAKATGQKQTAP